MERSPLHNFNLPQGLMWGTQRFLRCMNVNPIRAMTAVDNDESSDSEEYNNNRSIENRHAEVEVLEMPAGGRSSDDPSRKKVRFNLKPLFLAPAPPQSPDIGSVRKATSEDEDEISITREKLVMDFQTEVGKLKEAILKNNTPDDVEIAPSKGSPPVNSEAVQNSEKQYNNRSPSPPQPPVAEEINASVDDPMSEKKSTRPKRKLEKKEERAKFSIALSRKEIEDDFIAITGKKPPRKPNKRPKNIQNRLQVLFPGSRLCEVHPDLYK
ncbi:uncharacterized protein LOC111894386 [Lactuca sativa]|uniref:Uncharacterized protein n=1 Tax=Lactuca sativa TaxID=4236 RepID=A0A9R1VRW9_LACSA|nr:uncharacterized protein LOC111894386 [Lactuca sativa]KAJ0209486.1 hypothetical protein LSAT_V11C400163710 [Lactuca sativa]